MELNEGVLNLPHKYIGLHLLQHCIFFNKVQYWTRIAPRVFVDSLLTKQWELQSACLEGILGRELSRAQWSQARLPVHWGGLALNKSQYELGMQAIHVSDLVYLASCRQSLEYAKRLAPGYDEVCITMEIPVICHLSAFWTSEANILQNPNEKFDQASVLQALDKAIHRDLVQSNLVAAQVRLRAAAARDSGLCLRPRPHQFGIFFFQMLHLLT